MGRYCTMHYNNFGNNAHIVKTINNMYMFVCIKECFHAMTPTGLGSKCHGLVALYFLGNS